MDIFNILGIFVKTYNINININNKTILDITKKFEEHLDTLPKKTQPKTKKNKEIYNVVDAIMTISDTKKDLFGVLTKINRDTLYECISYIKSTHSKSKKSTPSKTIKRRSTQSGGDYDSGMLFFMFILSVISMLFFSICEDGGSQPRQHSAYRTNNARGFTSEGTDAERNSELRHWNNNSHTKKCNTWKLSSHQRARRHQSRIRRTSSGRSSSEGRARAKSSIKFEERRNHNTTNSD